MPYEPRGAVDPIRLETVRITEKSAGKADLTSSPLLTIDIIRSGNGIHRFFGTTAPCTAGDIYILPENLPHGYSVAESGEELIVERICFFAGKWLFDEAADPGSERYCYGVFRDGTAVACAVLTQAAHEEVCALTSAIKRELSEKRAEYHEAVKAYLCLLLVTVARYVGNSIKTPPEKGKREQGAINAVLRVVEERYHEPDLTLERIAGMLFLSPSSLSRSFLQYMGEPFSDFLRNYRMAKACRMLADKEDAVVDIVSACGLKDVPTFYRSFSRYTGTTPNLYRKHSRASGQNNYIKGDKNMSILSEISENLQIGKAKIVKELVERALAEGIEVKTILNDGLIAGMNIVGERFKNNEIFIPEVLVAARALNTGTALLKPYFTAAGVEPIGKVCIGTVQGDLHDIGKNIVKMMMEGKQLEVIDLGTDVSAELFVRTAKEEGCQIICCSALLTTTMDVMSDVVKEAEKQGIRDQVKIMIGGAPVSEDYCKKIGADVYTVDAASAAEAAVELCEAMKA